MFLVAFIEAFGWSRGETSIAYSVSQLVAGASSPLVGVLVDRLGPRRLILLGGVLLAAGLIASAFVDALWQMVVLYGVVMTLGANCLGLVVFVPILSRRFVRHRGMAISIVQSANGFARAFSAPLSQLLIAGDRLARRLSGAGRVHGGRVPAAGRAVPPRRARGDRRARRRRAAIGRAAAGHCAEAMRTPHFWLLFAVYLFTGLGSFLVSLHQLAFAVDIGFDKLYAAEVLGMGAFLALPGVIVTGTLSDYIGREVSAIVTYGLSIVGVVCALLITGPDQHLLLWLHACFFGLTWGARGPAITAKTADLFPGPQLGHDPRRHHHRQRARLGGRLVGGRAGSSTSPAAIGSRSGCRSSSTSAAASRSGRCAGRPRRIADEESLYRWHRVRQEAKTSPSLPKGRPRCA